MLRPTKPAESPSVEPQPRVVVKFHSSTTKVGEAYDISVAEGVSPEEVNRVFGLAVDLRRRCIEQLSQGLVESLKATIAAEAAAGGKGKRK